MQTITSILYYIIDHIILKSYYYYHLKAIMILYEIDLNFLKFDLQNIN